MFRPIRATTISLIAVSLLGGCKGADFFGPGEDESLPESHPAAVGPAAAFSARLVWSSNGHLAYVLPNYSTAVARLDGTGPARILHTASPNVRIVEVALSPDASEWFTVADSAGVSTLLWHRGGTAEVLTTRAGGSVGTTNGKGVAVAANGDFAYIVRPDSLFLKRGSDAPVMIATGCRSIATISPTGDGVVCHSAQASGYPVRFSLGGSATPIVGTESGGLITDLQWTSQGMHVMYKILLSHFTVERLTDPQSKFSTPSVQYPEFPGEGVFAEDGRSFAFITYFCAKTTGLFGCDKSQALVHHADAVQRTFKRLAVQTVQGDAELSISPDGRRIAYTMNGSLFVLPVN